MGLHNQIFAKMFDLENKAGAYITGQTIYVDGGWSIW